VVACHQLGDRVVVGHVDADESGLLADQVAGVPSAVLVDVSDNHLGCALGGEPLRDRPADADRGTGNDCSFPVDIHAGPRCHDGPTVQEMI
jgi:hypothetical protein